MTHSPAGNSLNPVAHLIDRVDERKELSALIQRGRPAIALLTGRRRIGKTYLLAHAWPPEQVFLFTAARTTPELNRHQLLLDFSAWSRDAIRVEDYPTWRTVFRLIADVATRRASSEPARPTVVILDEFQYLADGESGVAEVASELNAVWETLERGPGASAREAGTSCPILLVLSGSAVATMEALSGGGAPLYGRLAWQHTLQPFNYWYAAELAPFAALRDRALAYGLFGGTPRYLAAVDPTRSVVDNATDLLLSPRGEIRQLIDTALDQEEGLRDVSKYRAILRALADGRTQRSEIAQGAGLPSDNALREKLTTLIALGYLEQRRNVEAKANEAVRYAIADAAFRFHNRFVVPNASMLERYPADRVWETAVAPHLDVYMGFELERIAVQAYDRRALAAGLPMVARWGRWEGADRQRQPLEIDIIASLADGRTMTGAVKWERAPTGAGVHYAHLAMLRRAADAGRAWAHAALDPDAPLLYVAAGGFTAGFREAVETSGHPATCWDLGDLYAAG